jgi:hypothetical protein
MSDDSEKKKSDWAIPFLGRLCLIGWISSILFEVFRSSDVVRMVCVFFGPWSCAIVIIHGTILALMRRQVGLLMFVLLAIAPAIHLTSVAIRWNVFPPFNSPAVESAPGDESMSPASFEPATGGTSASPATGGTSASRDGNKIGERIAR